MAMQVGELGTFDLSGTQLVLSPGEPGNIDTYTFEAIRVPGNAENPSRMIRRRRSDSPAATGDAGAHC